MEAGAALRKLAGGLLIAAGVLSGLTGGVCGGFGVIWAVGYWGTGEQWGTLMMGLSVGAVSIGTGIVLFVIGRRLLRPASADRPVERRHGP